MLADERRDGRGGNGEQRGAERGAGAYNCRLWSRSRVHFDGNDWTTQAVILVRRCELGLVV
jgi:hypothetical protein